MKYLPFICLIALFGCVSTKDPYKRYVINLQKGKIKEDTSYVYWLPYKKGNRYLFIQGANSGFSHKGELSFDFKMKKGSKICAARPGTVIATKSDSDKGGLKDEFLGDGNHIIIQHDDGSTAHYWHLQQNGVAVKMGERVEKGQIIGFSGNTGYTAFPTPSFPGHRCKWKRNTSTIFYKER